MTDYTELITRLRGAESRCKRKLLDEAADTIEAMAKDMKYSVDRPDGVCVICKHYNTQTGCGLCGKCEHECWYFKTGRCFEWRGVHE